MTLDQTQKQFFRGQFRAARAAALADAEGFLSIIQILELIGQHELGEIGHLKKYETVIAGVAAVSPLSFEVPSSQPAYHSSFLSLYREMRRARNDAVHQGAHARTLTDHAVHLATILEDALMVESSMVSQFMVRDVVQASPWHPISYVRQQMLTHAFSYLPIWHQNRWQFVPEFAVARYVRGGPEAKRGQRLVATVLQAVDSNGLSLLEAKVVTPDTTVNDLLQNLVEHPILVVDDVRKDVLLGLLTPSDVL